MQSWGPYQSSRLIERDWTHEKDLTPEVSSLLALKLEVATSQGPVSNLSEPSSANNKQENRHLGPMATRNPVPLSSHQQFK